MPQSALILRVPEAEPFVARIRERFDPVARLGVPAHLTLLFPFADPARITPETFERARACIAASPALRFRLARIERFPGALYLAPEPAQPIVELIESLARRFPEHPPYAGAFDTIVPHLTVAQGAREELDAAERELRERWPESGIEVRSCTSVRLIEDSAGTWRTLREFELGPPLPGARPARP